MASVDRVCAMQVKFVGVNNSHGPEWPGNDKCHPEHVPKTQEV